jgi:hypothetical protein
MFQDDVVDQKSRGPRQYQPARPADDDQEETDEEEPTARAHQHPDIGPKFTEPLGGWLLRGRGGHLRVSMPAPFPATHSGVLESQKSIISFREKSLARGALYSAAPPVPGQSCAGEHDFHTGPGGLDRLCHAASGRNATGARAALLINDPRPGRTFVLHDRQLVCLLMRSSMANAFAAAAISLRRWRRRITFRWS